MRFTLARRADSAIVASWLPRPGALQWAGTRYEIRIILHTVLLNDFPNRKKYTYIVFSICLDIARQKVHIES